MFDIILSVPSLERTFPTQPKITATAECNQRKECCKKCMTIRQAAQVIVRNNNEHVEPTHVNLISCEQDGDGIRTITASVMSDHGGTYMIEGAVRLYTACENE